MDEDLSAKSKIELIAEVIKLRNGIREHRNSSGQNLCWYHPQLWALVPEMDKERISVPEWPQFLRGCINYRESLDRQLPEVPRTKEEF